MTDSTDYLDEVTDDETLVHLLDRVLDVGVVVSGDLRLSIANVDLIHIGLKLFIGSVETIERLARERLAAGEKAAP
jgi:hypothetical protein